MKLYSTSDEIRYLNRIGKHAEREYSEKRRIMLLKNYLAHLYLRDKWGEIDKEVVRLHCVKKLNGGAR